MVKKLKLDKLAKLEDVYLRLAVDDKNSVKAALAENASISETIQSKLLESGSGLVYQSLASNPCVSRTVLNKLCEIQATDEDATDWIIQGLCENPELPIDVVKNVLMKLKEDSYFLLLKAPSLNRDNKSKILEKVIKPTQYASNLEVAAACEELTDEQIAFLLKHESESVRRVLARNPVIDEKVQLSLAKDSSVTVRKALVLNVNLTKKAESILRKDNEQEVQTNFDRLNIVSTSLKKVESKLNYNEILANSDQRDLVRIGLDVQTPRDVLDKLLGMVLPSADSWLAVALAQNSSLNQEVLFDFASSKNIEVLKALAVNENTSLSLIDLLSKNKDPGLRSVVANRKRYALPPFMCD